MKLTTAIEIIEQRIVRPHMSWNGEDFKALHLSIEAMKARREVWSLTKTLTPALLPGETEDDDS